MPKQLDWIDRQNTREKLAIILAKPVLRESGRREWPILGGFLRCAWSAERNAIAWARTYDSHVAPNVWFWAPREVARVYLERVARSTYWPKQLRDN